MARDREDAVLQTLVPETIVRPVMGAITQLSTRASRLGTVGLIALVVSALAMMLTIDRALNTIWRVRMRRRIAQRLELDWIGRLDEANGPRHILLCDPATTPAEPPIAKLLLDPAPDLEATWKRAGFDAMRVADMLPTPATGRT
ncbi:MAG: YhjD/YihY/BrkB family envelope integrity protein [Caldimonas sp.]